MEITVEALAALVGGEILPPSGGKVVSLSSPSAENTDTPATTPASLDSRAVVITGVASISEAGPGDVTFFGNTKYLPALRTCQATCALVPANFSEALPFIAIRVPNPTLSFSQVLEKFTPAPPIILPGIHPSAIIAPNARIGQNVTIGPHVVIEPGAIIGDRTFLGANVYIGHGVRLGVDCKIYPNATLREHCQIGERVIIHSGAVLGSDGFGFEMKDGRYVKIPQTGIVQVDNDVEIGSNATIDRARFGRTWIGEGTKIDNLVQIAHNVVIGKHSIIVSQVGISGSSRLGNYVTLAGQVGVVGHIEIGDQAIVGAQSGVSKSIPAKEMWFGYPATEIQEQKSRLAHINRVPKLLERLKRLEEQLKELQRNTAEKAAPKE